MANYPVSLDTIINPTSGNTLDNPSHSLQHSDANDILEALEQKVGIGSSVAGSATAGHALVASTGGTTSWTTIGTAGISSGTATSGQVLTANGSGAVTFSTPTQGLTLLSTTSFSAVSSQAVSSFASSTYTNYRIMLRITNTTADATLFLKLRSSTTDSSASYNYAETIVVRAGTSGTQSANGGTSGFDIGQLDISGLEDYYFMTMDIIGINTAFPTGITFSGWFVSTAGLMYSLVGAGTHAVRSAFDGINIINSAGNMTGDISIYGYNK